MSFGLGAATIQHFSSGRSNHTLIDLTPKDTPIRRARVFIEPPPIFAPIRLDPTPFRYAHACYYAARDEQTFEM